MAATQFIFSGHHATCIRYVSIAKAHLAAMISQDVPYSRKVYPADGVEIYIHASQGAYYIRINAKKRGGVSFSILVTDGSVPDAVFTLYRYYPESTEAVRIGATVNSFLYRPNGDGGGGYSFFKSIFEMREIGFSTTPYNGRTKFFTGEESGFSSSVKKGVHNIISGFKSPSGRGVIDHVFMRDGVQYGMNFEVNTYNPPTLIDGYHQFVKRTWSRNNDFDFTAEFLATLSGYSVNGPGLSQYYALEPSTKYITYFITNYSGQTLKHGVVSSTYPDMTDAYLLDYGIEAPRRPYNIFVNKVDHQCGWIENIYGGFPIVRNDMYLTDTDPPELVTQPAFSFSPSDAPAGEPTDGAYGDYQVVAFWKVDELTYAIEVNGRGSLPAAQGGRNFPSLFYLWTVSKGLQLVYNSNTDGDYPPEYCNASMLAFSYEYVIFYEFNDLTSKTITKCINLLTGVINTISFPGIAHSPEQPYGVGVRADVYEDDRLGWRH